MVIYICNNELMNIIIHIFFSYQSSMRGSSVINEINKEK